MTENIIRKCDLFAANKNKIHRKFIWDYHLMSVLSSMVYTMENKEADPDRMRECLKTVKKNTGAFSPFRSSDRLFLVSKMALSEDPERYLKDVISIYNKIKKGHFIKDTYMVLAAVNIVDAGRVSEADAIISKFRDILSRMKKYHPMITSNDDMPMVICLAMTDKTADEILAEMEECFRKLKVRFRGCPDSVQGLSEVLALSEGKCSEKTERVIAVYDAFRSGHRKYSKEYGLASLGAFTGSSKDPAALAAEIIETESFLATKKGMGPTVMNRTQRLLFAALIVADCEGSAGNAIKNPIIVETIQTIIAMEMMTMVVAVTAASSASR